jgi:NAD(P)-dependent dehydrogenase (short-subunit alcohol dehydrogenase family)
VVGLLEGDTALVTGGASGIGRGIAKAFAAEGVRVVISDVSVEAGEQVAREIGGVFIASDLSQPGADRKLFEAALAELGQISIFVHSASPKRHESDTVFTVSDETWDAMYAVGVKAGFHLGRDIGAHMKERGLKGKMIFLTSLHAENSRNLPHYSSTKAGMAMVMKELARELGSSGIRVNALAPGAVPFGGFVADVSAWEPKIPMGRMGTPEELAGMAVALVCDRFSGYVTGTTVVVDGGLALYNWIPFNSPPNVG